MKETTSGERPMPDSENTTVTAEGGPATSPFPRRAVSPLDLAPEASCRLLRTAAASLEAGGQPCAMALHGCETLALCCEEATENDRLLLATLTNAYVSSALLAELRRGNVLLEALVVEVQRGKVARG